MFPEPQQIKLTKTGYLHLAHYQPAYKLATVLVFTVCISFMSNLYIALIANIFPILLAISAHISLSTLFRKLIPVNVFFIFLWIFLPLNISSGNLIFTHSGIVLAALITLKGNAIITMLLVVLGTSTINETCRGLLKLHLSEKFVTLLLLTYNNLFYMNDEYKKILIAARLRGFNSTRKLTDCKTSAYLAAMLLVRSWQKAQRVNKAMCLRGFSGKYPLLDIHTETFYSQSSKRFFICFLLISISLLLADIIS